MQLIRGTAMGESLVSCSASLGNPRYKRALREGHVPLRSPNCLPAGNEILQVWMLSNNITRVPSLVKATRFVENLERIILMRGKCRENKRFFFMVFFYYYCRFLYGTRKR